MASINFDEFYERVHPFLKKEGRDSDDSEIDGHLLHTVKLYVPVFLALSAHSLLESIPLNRLRNSIPILRLRQKLILKANDCFLGTRQKRIAPLTFARRAPKEILTQDFADYARQMSLPYLATVIDAGIKYLTARQGEPKI
jgi:hypothetical protein